MEWCGKPTVLETMWQKAGRHKAAWTTLRANGLPPPFETADSVRLTASGFILEGEGAQQVASPY